MDIEGKTAVVTGASRGVGKATALKLAELGCNVLVNYNVSGEQAEAVAESLRGGGVEAIAFQANVADDRACRAMMNAAVERFGRIDILVNNAATTRFIRHSDLEGVTDEAWDEILRVNVKGPFQCLRAALPHMERGKAGSVVNVASIAGVSGIGSSVPYSCSKAALINMTVALARALGPRIRVNAVAPGFIESDWHKVGFGEEYEQVVSGIKARSVLNSVCQPQDVAKTILSLITGSQLITGQTVVIDGGFLIGPTFS